MEDEILEIKLEVTITENKTDIQFLDEDGRISIIDTNNKEILVEQPTILFLLKDTTIIYIDQSHKTVSYNNVDFNKVIMITIQWEEEVEFEYLKRAFINEALANGISLLNTDKKLKIPANYQNVVAAYSKKVTLALNKFGYPLYQKPEVKEKSTKAQHRWNKAVSQIEFYINCRESKATVLWQKRNEMLLKAGAKMMPSFPLNKDGSVGFSAKFGEKIRSDHADKIKDFVTTKDIILKSVNEVGLFLYFGGTNSWLEMADADGKTIDEWTIVK